MNYGMVNVPMAVWIDEDGRIVRPAEPAGVSDHFRSMDMETFQLPDDDAQALVDNRERYVDALRDWVARGAESQYALSPDEVARRTQQPRPEDERAALHVRIGHHLLMVGDVDGAKTHFDAAVEISPHNWGYRRQSMVLDPDLAGTLNVQDGYWQAMNALGENSYYADIDMPGMTGRRDWQKP